MDTLFADDSSEDEAVAEVPPQQDVQASPELPPAISPQPISIADPAPAQDVEMTTESEPVRQEAPPEEQRKEEEQATGEVVDDQVVFVESELTKRVNELKKAAADKDAVTVFPEALIDYYLKQAGCDVADESLIKLVSLEVQNYVQEILEDVKKISTMKPKSARSKKKQKMDKEGEKKQEEEEKFILSAVGLESVLRQRRIATAQAPYLPTDSAV